MRVAADLSTVSGETLTLLALARDRGIPQRESLTFASVSVQVRRSGAPRIAFDQSAYFEELFLPIVSGMKVTCVEAASSAGSLSYNFYKPNSFFDIDPTTGCIFVKEVIPVDDMQNLTVVARVGESALANA